MANPLADQPGWSKFPVPVGPEALPSSDTGEGRSAFKKPCLGLLSVAALSTLILQVHFCHPGSWDAKPTGGPQEAVWHLVGTQPMITGVPVAFA